MYTPVQASVVEIRQQQTAITVRATGTLHARQSAVISAQLVGRIQQVLVRQGDTVRVSIYHKNLQRVVSVTGDVAGAEESPVYAVMKMNKDLNQLKLPACYTLARYNATMPESTDHYSMNWDGERHITIEVFRGLGLAFATVLLLIYVLSESLPARQEFADWLRTICPLGLRLIESALGKGANAACPRETNASF